MKQQSYFEKPDKYKKLMVLLTVMAVMTVFFAVNVLAAGAGAADPGAAAGTVDATNAFNKVMEILVPWIQKLGGVVMFVGGIMFALGTKNDDADSKTRGVNTLIAGAMVIGVATAYPVFLGG